MKRYKVQYRYSGGWTAAKDSFAYCGDAICRASEMSETGPTHRLVRVVDLVTKHVAIVYGGDGRIVQKREIP